MNGLTPFLFFKKAEQATADKSEKKFRKNCILKQDIKYRVF